MSAGSEPPPAAHAFWTVAAGVGEIRPAAVPSPEPDEAVVATLWSGISRGTETLVFAGGVPESEWERMRCPFQEGAFSGAVKYGYAAVGRVDSGPPGLLGTNVFCLHPHQDRFVVPADALLPLPAALPPRRAVLAANLETAINALWDSPVLPGQRIAVVGGGVVGLAVARLASAVPGAQVTLVDVDPGKATVAAALGVAFALPDAAPRDCDGVFEVSGKPAGLVTALDLAGDEAVVTVLSWFGSAPAALPLGGAFHARRLTLRASQVGRVAPAQRSRWSYRRRLALALDLLGDPAYDHLLTGESAFADLPQTMRRLAGPPDGTLCHVVRYS
ncbi:threonine dehydrogenase-like Zn-dependent dehydrogenase [Stella humosa]|uniref:Threonine dehydrogenase-like Zn-dependent dehydrogenase n=1 Tax=Stella humosa TaxID=94 RepID=A0A3N1KZQ4_9PROT|nr:zinc-binding alcohol dehydrogenase [Stella humosa]ROP83808.1 threonine dehydrogenase-like Zn-dependent dehydrogenase [Stella humosa]BBK32931.1 dehydrogenase [Stella humosa]